MERGWDETETGDRDREKVYEIRWTGQNERAAAISSLYLRSCPGEIETGDREREERRQARPR
jgi:hypothetical protein